MSLYDLRQNHRISKAQTENKRTARNVQESQESIEDLRQSVQKLSLVCEAMWQLLQIRSGPARGITKRRKKEFSPELFQMWTGSAKQKAKLSLLRHSIS